MFRVEIGSEQNSYAAYRILENLKKLKNEKEQKSDLTQVLNTELDRIKKEETAQYQSMLNALLHTLVNLNDTQLLQILLDRGANIMSLDNQYNTIWHSASKAKVKTLEWLYNFAVTHNACPSLLSKAKFAQTPLTYAVMGDNTDAVEFFLKKYADTEQKEVADFDTYSNALSFLVHATIFNSYFNGTLITTQDRKNFAEKMILLFKKYAGEAYFSRAFLLAVADRRNGALFIFKHCKCNADVLQKASDLLTSVRKEDGGNICREILVLQLASRFSQFSHLFDSEFSNFFDTSRQNSAIAWLSHSGDLTTCLNLYSKLCSVRGCHFDISSAIYQRIKDIITRFIDKNETADLDSFSEKNNLSANDLKQVKAIADANQDHSFHEKLKSFEKKHAKELKHSDSASAGYRTNHLLKGKSTVTEGLKVIPRLLGLTS